MKKTTVLAVENPFSLTGSNLSLNKELERLGIRTLDRERVMRIRREEIAATWIPVIGYVCKVATNGYYTLLAIGVMITIGVVGQSGFSLSGLGLASNACATLFGILWFLANYSNLRTAMRDAGAHWRRTRILKDKTGRYEYRGNNFQGTSLIPSSAKEIIVAIDHIPGAKAQVEYTANDPFIVVTRGRLFRETAYVFHWK